MDGNGAIKILAPVPGRCRVCAGAHKPGEPHERDSLYYQMRFYRENKRFPTWEDAMIHCSEERKNAFRAELSEKCKTTNQE